MASKKINPKQSEVWLFDPDPVKGSEIGKKIRPALVVSNNLMNKGPSGLVIIVPLTSKKRNIPSHIEINPPEGGTSVQSFAICEQIRSISKDRLIKKLGNIRSSKIMKEIYSWVEDLLYYDV